MAEIINADLDWQETEPSGPDCGERYVAFTDTWCCWVEFDKPSKAWRWGVSTYGDNVADTIEAAKLAVNMQVM